MSDASVDTSSESCRAVPSRGGSGSGARDSGRRCCWCYCCGAPRRWRRSSKSISGADASSLLLLLFLAAAATAAGLAGLKGEGSAPPACSPWCC